MAQYEALLSQLSALLGIIPEYWDVFGNRHAASIDTKKAILNAMHADTGPMAGSTAGSMDNLAEAVEAARRKPWISFIDPVSVISVNAQPFAISAYVPVNEGEEHRLTFSCSLEMEHGQREAWTFAGDHLPVKEQQWISGIRYIRVELTDNPGGKASRESGYYSLHVICKHSEATFPGGRDLLEKTCRVIITPDTCYIPPGLEDGKTWGLSANLYSLRSSRNWGIGDFADLKTLVGFAAQLKSGFIGINPLHAIPNTKPYGLSPYSPISRFYKNFIYIDMDAVPEVNASERAREITGSEDFRNELHVLRNGDLVDYEKIAWFKKRILRRAFDYFYQTEYEADTPRARMFRNYVSEEGMTLDLYALFVTLWEHMHATLSVYKWQDWPEEFRSPGSKAVEAFRALNERELLFHKYVQWLIDEQHRETSELAGSLGMPVGLYHDLAIGSVGDGSNAWKYQDLIAGGIDVGAPPDDFNPNGQNWSFPPLIPGRLRETGYELFIQIIRKNMRYNGALRIDHALGMFRLFWIPEGMSPEQGAYVSYPEEDLLRIIALESVRNKAMVIAEDLGTVGENVREALQRFRMLSYRLFYFERQYPDHAFASPEHYPAMALCSITTHDLPTIYGYWSGRDIEIKKSLNVYKSNDIMERHLMERLRDRTLLLNALKAQGIIPDDFPFMPSMSSELALALYEYLARTPCKLVAVSLDDIIGTLDQQNMPGVSGSYPNWMQKTPLGLEQMMIDRRFFALAEMFRKNNRGV